MAKIRAQVDKGWFADRIGDLGISHAEFGRRIGLDRSALSRTLSGERNAKASEAHRMAEVLGRPEHEVLKHLNVRNAAKEVGKTANVAVSDDATERLVGAVFGFSEGQARYGGKRAVSNDSEDYIVPPRGADPLFGCMAGTLTLLPDVDYAAPADPDWGKVYDD
ncbi:helix-turn-helix domain-containing protein [Arvimicrobium flavum]|uniref:helix-turn-helix domain-containing protein n=1 Tax=Arvimicrobium flavum TaxID=3393320 RepID=UPI00237B3D55|nr:helix-turn-helix transcriptional regulator [Mesorhizobium shangrilense]